MNADKIERNLLEKVTADFVELLERQRDKTLLTQAAARQSHFDKNYK